MKQHRSLVLQQLTQTPFLRPSWSTVVVQISFHSHFCLELCRVSTTTMRTATQDEKQANQKNRQLTLTNHKKPRTIAPFVNLDRKNVVLWSVVDTFDAATALCVSSERAKWPRICEQGMTVESRWPPINKLTIDELTIGNDERAWRRNANICCKVDEFAPVCGID